MKNAETILGCSTYWTFRISDSKFLWLEGERTLCECRRHRDLLRSGRRLATVSWNLLLCVCPTRRGIHTSDRTSFSRVEDLLDWWYLERCCFDWHGWPAEDWPSRREHPSSFESYAWKHCESPHAFPAGHCIEVILQRIGVRWFYWRRSHLQIFAFRSKRKG